MTESGFNPVKGIIFGILGFLGFVALVQGLENLVASLLVFWNWRFLIALGMALLAYIDTRFTFTALERYVGNDTPEVIKTRAFGSLFVVTAVAVVFGLTTFLPASRSFFSLLSIILISLSAVFAADSIGDANKR